jgi:transposase
VGEVLLFLDECDLHLQPVISDNWQPKGSQNRVTDALANRKSYCFGAIEHGSAEVTARTYERKRSGEFVEFLEVLRRKYAGVVHLVLDNFSIHYSKAVREYLSGHEGKFQFHFLPTYSPWLNAIETVWRQMKRAVCSNWFHQTIGNLRKAVHKYFRTHPIHEGAIRAAA